MSFDRHQGVSGENIPAYTPEEIDINLTVSITPERCPNCLLAEVSITPEDKRKRYFEVEFGDRWIKADNYEDQGYPFAPDIPVKIHTDGIFRAIEDEDVILPAMRVFAKDGYRGGMVEQSAPSDQTQGWYKREVEEIYGVGLKNDSGDLRVRMVPGGEFLTPKHQVNGAMAYDLFTATCSVRVWRTQPSWDKSGATAVINESPDLTLATQAMALAGAGQPYFEVTFDLSSISPPLSGTVYFMPLFTMQYANAICELLTGPLNFGPTAWLVQVDEGSGLKTFPYVGKVSFP